MVSAVALVGLSLIAAACGGDDGGSGDTTAQTVDQGVKSGIDSALQSTTSAADGSTASTEPAKEAPTSMEGWEALWEEERAAMLEKISSNGWGVSADGTTATGPEGFTIDLSACPAGWSNTDGLTDTEIKIGQTIPLSGAAAAYGEIAKGMEAHFAKVNDAGGIEDSTGVSRKVTYISKDDGYDSARTIPLVDELIDSERVFAVITLGSPNTMKTYDKLNQRCIPQPISMTGHPAWGDPVNHPWTTGEQMAYNTEAVLWGAFIEQNQEELLAKDGTITVAALVANNDFGKAYDAGFKAWIAQSPLKDKIEYFAELNEPTAPTITDPMTTLASKDPEVFIAMTFAAFCTQSMVEAANNGLKESAIYLFQPSVCKGNSYAGKEKVGGDGMAADGWYMVGGGLKALDSPTFDGDPFAVYAREALADVGIDFKAQPTSLRGVSFAWTLDQALRVASQMEGGLNRANLIIALRSFEMTPPHLLEGAKYNMNGNADAYLTEASEFSVYNTAKQGYDVVGDVIELSGKSRNCAFDQATASCL
ncbi:MAG: ABC transporter substrate-binding protein [Acidimicrobiia bacterium]